MARSPVDLDELVESWTLLDGEMEQVGAKRGAARLGFALLLKYFTRYGRFPRGRSELHDDAAEFVARQVGVPAADMAFYEWSGRTIESHRAQIRKHLGFRECSVEDAEKLTAWLSTQVCEAERNRDRVRSALLERCRVERIEPPSSGRVERIMGSAVRTAEKTLTQRIAARISATGAGRVHALVADDADEDDGGDDAGADVTRRRGGGSLLAFIRDRPGNVSLESMLVEIDRLLAVRGIGLPAGLFDDVAPKVVSGWRARAAVEWPSHLREHAPELRLTLLAALLFEKEREITDALVDLLIGTVHRIGARAEKKVTEELVNEFKRVAGKETILFKVAEASLARPDGAVRDVVFPVVSGGEGTLRDLVAEYKTSGPTYRRTVQTTLRTSYTRHYRRGLIRLLGVLEFRSSNTHRPVIDALAVIARHANDSGMYYPLGEMVPSHRGVTGDWADLVYRADTRGRRRVVRMAYEVATFQALREALKCKDIWVAGADQWRDPDQDLPVDFEQHRVEHYRELRKPLDPAAFITELRGELRDELAALHEALPTLDWVTVSDRRSGAITLRPLEAQPEPVNLRRIKAELLRRWGTVPLIDILKGGGAAHRLPSSPAVDRDVHGCQAACRR